MTLHLHNTLTRTRQDFAPIDPGHVRIYVCGPTVYDLAHIGNARPVVVFDVLVRLLRRLYPRVTYVRNITDIDDKILAAAAERGEPIDGLTGRTAGAFHADMAALGALPPDVEPRATQHVPQMLAMIGRLVERGHAYAAEGHVLFNVPSMADYGRLSGRNRDELIAGARVDVAPYKRDPADFVLWKPSTPDQPGWDSPWGRGRPGWHIECSAMAATHLGATFDIHGGGLDLIFPHHENEIAQSRCAHGTPVMARYWVHNGYLIVDGEKMSKSLGNFLTVRDLLAEAPGEALRLALLATHYRQPLDFTREGLRRARATLDRLYGALRGVDQGSGIGDQGSGIRDQGPGDVPAAVLSALEDDLNTPLAIAQLHDIAGRLNKAADPDERARLAAGLRAGGAVLGLLQGDAEAWFKGQPIVGTINAVIPAPTMQAFGIVGYSEEWITSKITARAEARSRKDFAEADRIRAELADQGILLEDTPKGTTWRRAG